MPNVQLTRFSIVIAEIFFHFLIKDSVFSLKIMESDEKIMFIEQCPSFI